VGVGGGGDGGGVAREGVDVGRGEEGEGGKGLEEELEGGGVIWGC